MIIYFCSDKSETSTNRSCLLNPCTRAYMVRTEFARNPLVCTALVQRRFRHTSRREYYNMTITRRLSK